MSDNTSGQTLLTTGEIASACGVSVRTVQYYDEKGLLVPTSRSEGGRRLYDDAARRRLETICVLKRLGLSLKAIRGVLTSDHSAEALRILLIEQEKELEAKVAMDKETLAAVHRTLAKLENPAPQAAPQPAPADPSAANDTAPETVPDASSPDMEHGMSTFFADRGTRLYRTQRKMLLEGVVLSVVEWVCIIGGIVTGNWWPLIAIIPLVVIITTELVWMYHRDARYVCPHCGATFQPNMREFFFATHTPKTRKLTCISCGQKGWCAEVAAPPEVPEL